MPAPLSAREKRTLKSLGQKLTDDCHLGKAGLTESFLAHVQQLLDRKELVKLRLAMDVQGQVRKDMASELADVVQAHCLAVTGKTVLLYRANPTLPPEKRVLAASPEGSSEED